MLYYRMSENCCPSLIILLRKDSELRKEPTFFLVLSQKYKIRYSNRFLSTYSKLIQEKKKDSSLTFLSSVIGLWSWQRKQQTSEWHTKIKGQDGAESPPYSAFYKSKPQYSQRSEILPPLSWSVAFASEFPWDQSQAILILWIHVGSSGDAPAGRMMPNGVSSLCFILVQPLEWT